MKKLVVFFLFSFLLIACKEESKQDKTNGTTEEVQQEVAYASFGDKITPDATVTKEQIIEKYKNLKPGDTVTVKFTTTVNSVCQAKGCWMRLDLGDNEAMVKFKDYGFFMPKNIAGKEVIVNGKAFVSEMSVEEQRHYAEDAGKSKEEIEAITTPKVTYSFEADGVLVKK